MSASNLSLGLLRFCRHRCIPESENITSRCMTIVVVKKTRSRRQAGRRMPTPEHRRTHGYTQALMHAQTDGQLENIMPSAHL